MSRACENADARTRARTHARTHARKRLCARPRRFVAPRGRGAAQAVDGGAFMNVIIDIINIIDTYG